MLDCAQRFAHSNVRVFLAVFAGGLKHLGIYITITRSPLTFHPLFGLYFAVVFFVPFRF